MPRPRKQRIAGKRRSNNNKVPPSTKRKLHRVFVAAVFSTVSWALSTRHFAVLDTFAAVAKTPSGRRQTVQNESSYSNSKSNTIQQRNASFPSQCSASQIETMRELFDAKFSEALKTVGKQFEFVELYDKREQFKEQILKVIGTDLNGYRLDDAAIDYLEQTRLELLNPNNILDADGIKKITELTPSRGFAAELGAAGTVVLASGTGLPISTTHTLVGAVLGVGLARGIGALNLRVIGSIFLSWIVTLPAGALLAILFFYIFKGLFS